MATWPERPFSSSNSLINEIEMSPTDAETTVEASIKAKFPLIK